MNRFSCLNKTLKDPVYLEILQREQAETLAVNEETGELHQFIDNKPVSFDGALVVDRFSLQSISRKILNQYRVNKCLWVVQDKNKNVGVHKSLQHNSTFFSNLQTCGSVWHCPVCAAKISERRAQEVQKCLIYAQQNNYIISFVTRTVPHQSTDSLDTIFDQYKRAEGRLTNSKGYRSMKKSFAVLGSIKVYEMTVGLNGWHLHTHELFIHTKNTLENSTLDKFYLAFQSRFYSLWADSALFAGFDSPTIKHGLQVQNGDFAADYIAKFGREPQSNWRVHHELSKQHIKSSRSGFSPFDLLRLYRESPSAELSEIILEYGENSHRKRQMIWSRGLKKLVDVVNVTDAEIAAVQEDEAFLLGTLSPKQWLFITRHHLRVDVLIILKKSGFDELLKFLFSIGMPDHSE